MLTTPIAMPRVKLTKTYMENKSAPFFSVGVADSFSIWNYWPMVSRGELEDGRLGKADNREFE